MKRLGKVLKVLILVAVMLIGFSGRVQTLAVTQEYTKVAEVSTSKKIFDAGKSWLDLGKSQQEAGTTPENFVDDFIGIGQVLVSIGIATILIVSVIMALKWITATPDKQAKLKQQLVGLAVAIVVIFGAVGIWNLVRGIMTHVENNL